MLTITLPLPHANLSPNARVHHMALHRRKKAYRKAAGWAARAALINANMTAPLFSNATAECRFYFTTNRERDADNLQASMKSAMDGLTDAGIWIDDSVVSPLPPVLAIDRKNPRVEIVVSEIRKVQ